MKKSFYTLICLFYSVSCFSQKTGTDYYKAGRLQDSLGNCNAAIEDFTKAFQLESSNEEYIICKAMCQYHIQNITLANATINEAIKLFPNSMQVKLAKGWLFIYSDEFELAVNWANELKRNSKINDSILVFSGIANRSAGNYKEAINDFSTALITSPSDETILNVRAETYVRLEQHANALKDYNTLLTMQPKNTEYLLDRAICKSSSEDYNGAMVDFNKVIQLDDQNAIVYFERGKLKFTLGDEKGAIDDYSKSIALDPKNSEAYCSRAISKARIKDNNGSILDFNKSISIDPQNAVAYYFRGYLYVEMKNKKSACSDFSKAGELGLMDAYTAIKEHCK